MKEAWSEPRWPVNYYHPRTIDEGFPIVSDAAKITDISQWGDLFIGDTQFQFFGCSNMSISATDTPDLSKTTSLRGAFVFGANLSREKTKISVQKMVPAAMVSLREKVQAWRAKKKHWRMPEELWTVNPRRAQSMKIHENS